MPRCDASTGPTPPAASHRNPRHHTTVHPSTPPCAPSPFPPFIRSSTHPFIHSSIHASPSAPIHPLCHSPTQPQPVTTRSQAGVASHYAEVPGSVTVPGPLRSVFPPSWAGRQSAPRNNRQTPHRPGREGAPEGEWLTALCLDSRAPRGPPTSVGSAPCQTGACARHGLLCRRPTGRTRAGRRRWCLPPEPSLPRPRELASRIGRLSACPGVRGRERCRHDSLSPRWTGGGSCEGTGHSASAGLRLPWAPARSSARAKRRPPTSSHRSGPASPRQHPT